MQSSRPAQRRHTPLSRPVISTGLALLLLASCGLPADKMLSSLNEQEVQELCEAVEREEKICTNATTTRTYRRDSTTCLSDVFTSNPTQSVGEYRDCLNKDLCASASDPDCEGYSYPEERLGLSCILSDSECGEGLVCEGKVCTRLCQRSADCEGTNNDTDICVVSPDGRPRSVCLPERFFDCSQASDRAEYCESKEPLSFCCSHQGTFSCTRQCEGTPLF